MTRNVNTVILAVMRHNGGIANSRRREQISPPFNFGLTPVSQGDFNFECLSMTVATATNRILQIRIAKLFHGCILLLLGTNRHYLRCFPSSW